MSLKFCQPFAVIKFKTDLCLGLQAYNDLFTLPPIYSSGFDLFAPYPEPNLKSTYFLSVFDIKLWISIIVALFLMILCLCVFGKYYKMTLTSSISTIFDMFQISNENKIDVPSPSFKILNFVIGIFLFMTAASFSAILITSLTKLEYHFPFTGIDDIWNQREYAFCVHPLESSYNNFLNKNKSGLVLNAGLCDTYFKSNESKLDVICSSKNSVFFSSFDVINNEIKEQPEK